jgi:hypothetical protein
METMTCYDPNEDTMEDQSPQERLMHVVLMIVVYLLIPALCLWGIYELIAWLLEVL